MVAARHPWKLVGPWYRASNAGGVAKPRTTAPVVQKYADTDFANRLTREPQASLKYTAEDFVQRMDADPDVVITPEVLSKREHRYKLFLDIHNRFYVVIMELHCDVPGFPSVSRDQVCEAGFVVRRRIPSIPKAAKELVARNRSVRQSIEARLLKHANTRARHNAAPSTSTVRNSINIGGVRDFYHEKQRMSLESQLAENLTSFKKLIIDFNLQLSLQGWINGEAPNTGAWEDVEEEPQELAEQVIPMFPLIADPTDPTHSSRGATQWFGVIPTSSSDVDSQHGSRFDDDVLYEIRCFVRRHKPGCPKLLNQTDCSGELIWSAPTEPYQIASAFDVDGHSHKPTTIKMPNLKDLRNQASVGPPGRGASLSLVTPEGSGIKFTPKGMDMPTEGLSDGPGEICFYFPLLFFIVAFFVFQIFLPILLFVLNLWFLLKLKLCLSPSLAIDAGLAADLKQVTDLQAKLENEEEVRLGAGEDGSPLMVVDNVDDLKAELAKLVVDGVFGQTKEGTGSFNDNELKELLSMYTDGLRQDPTMDAEDFADLVVNLGTDFEDPDDPVLAGKLVNPKRGMVYFDKVQRA